MDHSLPGSSVHGIFQARVLEWGAIAFSESTRLILKSHSSHNCSSLCYLVSNHFGEPSFPLKLISSLENSWSKICFSETFQHWFLSLKVYIRWTYIFNVNNHISIASSFSHSLLQGIKPGYPALQTDSLQFKSPGKPTHLSKLDICNSFN